MLTRISPNELIEARECLALGLEVIADKEMTPALLGRIERLIDVKIRTAFEEFAVNLRRAADSEKAC